MQPKSLALAITLAMLPATSTFAASSGEIETIRSEIKALQKQYENRIIQLENKISVLESKKTTANATPAGNKNNKRHIRDNSFNPSIGLILNGRFSQFSEDESEIAGFAVGEEGERGSEGFALGESELNASATIDDKFYGHLTAAIVREEGEDKLELEEAYIQTLSGSSLPDGLTLKAGRAFWTLGYLNEHHSHADDFADRPLTNRVFLHKSFNDDGLEFSYVLPTDLYAEIGGGVFRGDDFPFGSGDGQGIGGWSAFARIGNDIGANQSWRIGLSTLQGEAAGGRDSNEDTVHFTGDTDIYVADLRYTLAPTGNPRASELTLQSEYFWRDESGTYEDSDFGTGVVAFDELSSGWYAQAVYKFHPQWRIGARYSRLNAADVPAGLIGSALDSENHDPKAIAAMLDWTNSEFSRVRLQFNREELSRGNTDNQFMLQYIMSLGAHGAHKY